MPQLSWTSVAVIAVFGAIFIMVITETESRSSSTFSHIRHRPDKSAINITPSSVLCTEEGNWRTLDGIQADRTTDKPKRLSICDWQDTESSRDDKQFAGKLESVQVPIIPPDIGFRERIRDDRSLKEDIVGQREYSNQLEEDTLSTMEEERILSTASYTTENDAGSTKISTSTSADNNESNLSNSSMTSVPIRSEKLVYNSTDSIQRLQYPIDSPDGTLESPLIVSPKEKSWDADSRSHSKKDHSKASINLLEGQPNKVFYEIKPSLNTAMRADDDDSSTQLSIISTTKRHFLGFKLPSVPSSFGKFGPFFMDEVDHRNITERIGSTVQLDCRIGLLGDKKVTWFQPNKDSIRLLTVGNGQYSADERLSLKFQYPDNWRLQIAYATLRDSGIYKCQVEIDPTNFMVKTYHVIITAPTLNITDDSGRPISGERHLKAGSTLRLRCEGRDVLERLNESLLWTRGDEILTTYVSENRTTELVGDREIPVISSTLVVEKASPRHAGNYSCIVPERAKTTIAVHVLNGELPAAVHHGNGVSSAVPNVWLIHLTISYGFFR